jgi:hypothetical protein
MDRIVDTSQYEATYGSKPDPDSVKVWSFIIDLPVMRMRFDYHGFTYAEALAAFNQDLLQDDDLMKAIIDGIGKVSLELGEQ